MEDGKEAQKNVKLVFCKFKPIETKRNNVLPMNPRAVLFTVIIGIMAVQQVKQSNTYNLSKENNCRYYRINMSVTNVSVLTQKAVFKVIY